MNTYQRQLLDKLINELTANLSPNLHAAQMLAAELKGALGITPMMTLNTETGKITPTPDADGWVENTGTMPECRTSQIKYRCGEIERAKIAESFDWSISPNKDFPYDITHYRPA